MVTWETRKGPWAKSMAYSLVPVRWARSSVWPGIMESGLIDRLFMDRGGDDGLYAPFLCQGYGFLNVLHRRLAGHGINLAVLEFLEVDVLQVQHLDEFPGLSWICSRSEIA